MHKILWVLRSRVLTFAIGTDKVAASREAQNGQPQRDQLHTKALTREWNNTGL